ncbi:hypothetical protein QVD17_29796 [Tagetes erecta]|uniref:CASP-like protein n=1 Tax=Tagetes erecta TaxID=13708 RepID=A0AAD8K1K5_TARER|nr:hypothetical protein QVD17_29796 [Tagetes erecta]
MTDVLRHAQSTISNPDIELKVGEMETMKIETFLRVCVTLVLLTTACLVRFDSQTSLIFTSYSKTATFRDMNDLFVLVFLDIAAAGYNIILLVIRRLLSSRLKPDMRGSYKHLAWFTFLFDQAVAYLILASNSAGLVASIYAITGDKHHLFWMKLCNKFNRFCIQVGGALLCGYVAFLLMVAISLLSGYGLFRHYSPKTFLVLK